MARSSARAVVREGALVPAVWKWEIQNALLAAERRERISGEYATEALRYLAALPIQIEMVAPAIKFGSEFGLARRMGLSVYDAAYLELSMRRGLPLITRDAKLTAAAKALRVLWHLPKT